MATPTPPDENIEPKTQAPLTTQPPQQARQQPITNDPWRQISDGLHWLHERSFPLTGLMLAVAVSYLFSFIIEEHVPVSIAFTASALFILFAMVVVLIALLTILVLSPTLALFVRFGPRSNNRVIDLLDRRNNNKKVASLGLIGVWFIPLAFIGAALGLIYWKDQGWAELCVSLVLIVLALLSAFVEMVTIWLFLKFGMKTQQDARDWWSVWKSQGWLVAISMIPQLLLMNFVFLLAAKNLNNSDGAWTFVGYILLGGILLGFLQLVGAKVLATSIKADRTFSIVNVALASTCLITVLGLYPFTGSWLTKQALQFTNSGARACAVLSWTADGAKQFRLLRDPADESQTKPLRILMESDGQYLVRDLASKSKWIDFIPRSIITGIDDCTNQ